jgi:hypothetical protein
MMTSIGTNTPNSINFLGVSITNNRVCLQDYDLKGYIGYNKNGENLHDSFGNLVLKDNKTYLRLYSRWQGEELIDTTTENWETTAKDSLAKWGREAKANGPRTFKKEGSKIGTDLSLDKVCRPSDKPASASNDDTDNRFSVPISESASRFLDPKAPKFATTFMGKTLIAGSTEPTDVVTFPENPAYNISVTYDPETGYTVKSQKGGIPKNGKVFKKAEDAEGAIKKYKTRTEQHLADTMNPEEAPNRFTTETNIPNLFNANFKGLDFRKIQDTRQ